MCLIQRTTKQTAIKHTGRNAFEDEGVPKQCDIFSLAEDPETHFRDCDTTYRSSKSTELSSNDFGKVTKSFCANS